MSFNPAEETAFAPTPGAARQHGLFGSFFVWLQRRALLGFVALTLVTSVGARVLTADIPLLNVDEASFAATAVRAMARHEPLMKDTRDNKPPGVYLPYLAAFELGGPYNMRFVRYETLLIVLATAGALGLSLRRLAGGRVGVLAGGLYLLMTSLSTHFLACKSELLMNLPLALALGLGLQGVTGRSLMVLLAAGFSAGLAALCKQPAAIVAAGIVLGVAAYAAWFARAARRADVAFLVAVIGSGFATAIAGVALLYYRLGAFPEFFLQTFQLPADLSKAHLVPLQRRLFRAFTYFEEYSAASQILFFAGLVGAIHLCLPRLAWPGVAPRARDALRCIVPPTTAMSLLAFFSAPELHESYFVMTFVPLSVAAAIIAGRVFDRDAWTHAAPSHRVLIAGCAVLALGSASVRALEIPVKHLVDKEQAGDAGRIVGAIDAARRPGDTLFVWGWSPELYVETGLPPATRFTVATSVVGISGEVGRTEDENAPHLYYEPGAWNALLADLEAERPHFIVDAVWMMNVQGDPKRSLLTYPRLRDYVLENYEAVVTDEGPYGATLYRRK